MKKSICILFAVAVILLGCGNTTAADGYGSFTLDKTYSYDQKFYAVQTAKDAQAVVSVYSSEDETKVFDFIPARARDFWGICWEKDTYNIWIQSADIGIYCYTYTDGKWVLDNSQIRPDYIISKYDK